MTDARQNVRGMLTLEELRTRIGNGDIDTVVVENFTDHYGRLMGKRYDAEMFVESIAEEMAAHGCNYLLDDRHGDGASPRLPIRQLGELGYGDFHLVPDMATLRSATWLQHSALILCDVHDAKTHAPTSALRRDRFSERKPMPRGRWASTRSPRRSWSTISFARATLPFPVARFEI